MSERVQQLLREVRRASVDEKYRPELGSRYSVDPTRSLDSLQQEIAGEIAHSLSRAGRKLERALAGLHQLLEQKAHRDWTTDELEALHAEFARQRSVAEEKLYHLKVQREALGFRRHDDLERLYPIPHWQ